MLPTDEMFNGSSRQVSKKLLVYFTDTPVEISKDNYLISCDIEETTWCSASKLFNSIEPNTLDATIANVDRLFSPSNLDSPYASSIGVGVKIEVLASVNDSDWIPMGTFFTTDWSVSVDGLTVDIFASDNLINVLKGDPTRILPQPAISYRDFINYYFARLGFSVSVDADASLLNMLQWGLSTGSINDDLTELSQATWSMCGFNRKNELQFIPISSVTDTRAVLTDDDQIVSISAKQSIIKTYDGSSLTYCAPSASLDEILRVDNMGITAGISEEMCFPFNKTPVVGIADVSCDTTLTKTVVESFRYNPEEIFVCVSSSGVSDTTGMVVRGWYLPMLECLKESEGSNLFKCRNNFIQYGDYATQYKIKLDRYAASSLPTLEVDIHGNLLFYLGDKIEINSAKYATWFLGKIVGIKTSYDGSLKQTLTLLDASIIE